MKKQYGMTLVEIMIALALGIFIISATLSVYINTIKSSSNTIKAARLNHDLNMAMTLMSNDIKRAGFWGGAIIASNNLMSNPFSAATTNIRIFNLAAPTTSLTTTAGDCVLYSYDADSNAAVAGDGSEHYGFRLNNGVIEMRLTGTTTADCSNGTWQAITDGSIVNVTDVQFSFAPLTDLDATSRCYNPASTPPDTNALACNPAPTAGQTVAEKRVVNIILTAGLVGADNAEVTKTLRNTVRVRNNRIYIQ